MRGHVAEQRHLPCVKIHLEVAQVGAEGEVRKHPARPQVLRGRLPLRAEEGPESLYRDIAPPAHRESLREAHFDVGTGSPLNVQPQGLEWLPGFLGHGPQHAVTKEHARFVDGVPRHEQLPRRRGGAGQRREGGVPEVHRDPVHRNSQHLRGDLGERRCLAAADVRYPAADGQAPVELESDPRGRRIVQPDEPAVGLDIRGDAAPNRPARP